jgi:hypothetical protein
MASREQIGALARQLRTDATFADIVKAMKATIITAWANSASGDAGRREELYRDVQAIGRLEIALQAAADSLTLDERKSARNGT